MGNATPREVINGAHSPIRNDIIPASSCTYEQKYHDTSLHMQPHLVPLASLQPHSLIDTAGDMSVDVLFSYPLPIYVLVLRKGCDRERCRGHGYPVERVMSSGYVGG